MKKMMKGILYVVSAFLVAFAIAAAATAVIEEIAGQEEVYYDMVNQHISWNTNLGK